MGVLITSAEKVEAGVEELRKNLRNFSEENKAAPRMRSAWNELDFSLHNAGTRLKPMMQRLDPEDKVELGTRRILAKAEFQARLILTDVIGRTIVGLERVKKRLERGSGTRGYAA